MGLGSGWLTQRAQEFLELYPELELQLVFDNEEIDSRCARRTRPSACASPSSRTSSSAGCFTVHLHVYAAPSYLARHGTPETVEDLDRHRIITFGEPAPNYLRNLNALETAGLPRGQSRSPIFRSTT